MLWLMMLSQPKIDPRGFRVTSVRPYEMLDGSCK